MWIVNGVKYNWGQVAQMIRSGTWTVEEAARNICMSPKGIVMRLGLTPGAGTGAGLGGAGAGTFLGLPTVAGVATAVGIGLVGAAVLIIGAGLYYHYTADKPVDFGDRKADIERMTRLPEEERESLRRVEEPVAVEARSTEKYHVWVMGGYKEVIVGRKTVIEEQPSNTLKLWGLEPIKVKDRNPEWRSVLGPFDTAEEARRAYEENVIAGSLRHLPLSAGTVMRFRFDNQEHHVDNALRFLR